MGRGTGARKQLAQGLDGLGGENVLGGAAETIDELDFAFAEFLTNIDAKRDAGEVSVLEFHSGALVPVVEEDVEAGLFEVGGDLLAGGGELGVGGVGDGDDDLEGSDGGRHDVGVRLAFGREFGGGGLDGGGQDALDADAVAAHGGGGLLAVAVEDRGSHGGGVLAAELEDVADLDRLAELKRGAAGGAALAL